MDGRELRALQIAATTKLELTDGRWPVPSQSGKGRYLVVVTEGGWECTCPDWEERRSDCKHVLAVTHTLDRESGGKPVDLGELVKVTYSQDWPAYNLAQTREGEHFPQLLADLCSLVPQPPHGTGRRPLPLSDMCFAMVQKVYSRFSSRRLISSLRADESAGHIANAPSFNSVLRYMRDPALTPILHELVAISSLPLTAVETNFAPDASGFGTDNSVSWFDHKHGRLATRREWVKLHLICGVQTHIVTGVLVTAGDANDSPHLEHLVRTTAQNFDVREVSADKGYSSKKNASAVESVGAVPFIAFKGNTVRPAEGTAWARMYHYCSLRRDEFLDHYHRRSNVETVFSMIKRKFGDDVRGRTPTAQLNEVLCKVVAHNLCVLIASFYELGIDPTFTEMPERTVA